MMQLVGTAGPNRPPELLNSPSQVVLVFYLILYRITMTAAMREVERTRSFVAYIPYHVLSEEVRALVSWPCLSSSEQEHNSHFQPALMHRGRAKITLC